MTTEPTENVPAKGTPSDEPMPERLADRLSKYDYRGATVGAGMFIVSLFWLAGSYEHVVECYKEQQHCVVGKRSLLKDHTHKVSLRDIWDTQLHCLNYDSRRDDKPCRFGVVLVTKKREPRGTLIGGFETEKEAKPYAQQLHDFLFDRDAKFISLNRTPPRAFGFGLMIVGAFFLVMSVRNNLKAHG